MSKDKRQQLIKSIEEILDVDLICYITSTRRNLEWTINSDCFPIFYDHLKLLNAHKKKNFALFISSYGGDGSVPNVLVRLFRHYYDQFSAIVPFYAYSAATQIILGADKIYTHPMATLGSIDNLVSNEFSPKDQFGRRLHISIEDISAFIRFVKNDWELKEPSELVHALNMLSTEIHPITLGYIKRALEQSKDISKSLLKLHMKDEKKVDKIVEGLTTGTFYHGQSITSTEAKSIGLSIEQPSTELEAAVWDLYNLYSEEMKLFEPFDAGEILNRENKKKPFFLTNQKLVVIESKLKTNWYSADFKLIRPKPSREMDPTEKEFANYYGIPILTRQNWEVEK